MTPGARLLRAALLQVLLLLGAAARADAQPAAYRTWRTLETEHFNVHAPRGLEREARVAGAAAERAYAQLSRELAPPRGRIELVVSDDADYSNGFALVVPSNRIVVFATPPIQNQGLRLNEDWLALVVTHELMHVFHLDRVRGVWSVAQSVFGRAPYLFPNAYGPSWLTEGLAVYEESRLTTGGRLRDAEHQTVARASAQEGRLPRLDELALGTARFPGGLGAYAYGSLFIDHLARTRGDSSVRRFVDAQSAQPLPFWIDRAAEQGFGVTFTRAYAQWRDSVQRSIAARRAPLPGWRELTAHGYYASSPRWVNDSTLVYTGTDGRETNAAYLVTTSGSRTRLGRRDAREANVPLPDGGFLYAQLEVLAPQVVRSDLYRSSRDGHTTRLTRGQRLIQPDARRDGTIVAVQLAPTRSRLVLLDPRARIRAVLREGGADETWSEPRWSPDGQRIAAVRRQHGGHYSIQIIHAERGTSELVAESAQLLSSPSWSPDGASLLFVSESEGTPRIVMAGSGRAATVVESPSPGLATPEISPSGTHVAAVELRADGYHIGIAPVQGLVHRPTNIPHAAVDTSPESEAAGRFVRYSPWRSLVPRYWFPAIEAAPARGTLLGATTAGSDAVGRHVYSAYLAVPTTGSFPVGSFAYRYAGLRRPVFDLTAFQDYTAERSLLSGGTTDVVGTLLKRTRDASLVANFVRPRVRSAGSVSVGVGLEHRGFATDPGMFLAQLDTVYGRNYLFQRLLLAASWNNVQRPSLSISQEDGVALGLTLRQRWRSDLAARTRSASAVGTVAAFKSLDLSGFAHHVVALRGAAGIADRKAATSLEVGGTSGTSIDVLPGYTAGEGRRTFGVRGFPSASVFGTSAATATLEYRAPLVLAGRGLGLLPLFFDRTSLSLFGDYGVAACVSDPLYSSTCSPSPRIGRPIASAGVELGLSAAVLEWDVPQSMRFGVAVPVVGRERVGANRVSPYLAFGLSF